MFDIASFTVGLFSGGFLGALGAIIVKTVRINQLETDVLILGMVIDDAKDKLRLLTARDSKGRFTGGKKCQ